MFEIMKQYYIIYFLFLLVHKNCTQEGSCSRFLKIRQEDHQMVLNPELEIEWDASTYSVSQVRPMLLGISYYMQKKQSLLHGKHKIESYLISFHIALINIILKNYFIISNYFPFSQVANMFGKMVYYYEIVRSMQ